MKRIVLLLLLVACSKEAPHPASGTPLPPGEGTGVRGAARATLPPPTTDAARELVTTSGEFSQYEFTNAAYTLPLRKSAMNEPQLTAAKQLAAAKWLLFRGDYVVLTEKALSDKRFLSRPNDTVDIVPLARKEVSGVTAARPLPDGNVAVDFDWKWIPNEVGVAFKTGMLHDRYAALGHATATLMNDGGNWSVLRVEPR